MPRKGATDAWVTGTHAEHAETTTLERHFSAASSGGDRRRCYAEPQNALAETHKDVVLLDGLLKR
jgi:hypothetical protein